MQLAEALRTIAQANGEQNRAIHLLCGFTPLHLETFTRAYLARRFPGTKATASIGLYGDLEGNILRARKQLCDGAIVVIEWSDLDQRLSFRASAGWSHAVLADIGTQVEDKCWRLAGVLNELSEAMPVTVVAPTFGYPRLAYSTPSQASDLELRLNASLADFLRRLGEHGRIRVTSGDALALSSPRQSRHDVKMDLLTGFPYTMAHADAIAELSINCLFPVPAKKGLITDLDNTLWKGILGDDGIAAISWSLEGKSQIHALYQQTLASLADSGVLIAIASKNDPAIVTQALAREDILIASTQIFPVEASWGVKSDAIDRILKAWNVGPDSVVFVDDSPMELAEVSEKHPLIECFPFPTGDPAAAVQLLSTLRARFGRNEVRDEDRLRLQSLRQSAEYQQEAAEAPSSEFLQRLDAKITFEASGSDARAFELVNKTNQFNLNGRRYTEAEWKTIVDRPGGFLVTASYDDRFGPLGKIAVIGGYQDGDACIVDIWVLSCRAFSRQIEFQTVRRLLETTGAKSVSFAFRSTERNGPTRDFLSHFFGPELSAETPLCLRAEDFNRLCPPLFHQVNDKWTVLQKS